MKCNKKTAMYKEQTFNKGDIMRINDIGAFSDCIIVGFGEMNEGMPFANGTIYAKLARPYAYVSEYSILTGVEYIEFVSLRSLYENYKRTGTERII